MTTYKELREAIDYYDDLIARRPHAFDDNLKAVVEAAKRDLSTLSREVEIEGWAVVRNDGVVETIMRLKENADAYAEACDPRAQVVRLTGKATLAGKP